MQKSSVKIVFFGTADFAVPVLEALVKEGYDVVAVVTQPDKPTGRKQVLTPPPIKLKADGLNLKVLQPEKLRGNPELAEGLKKLHADIGILAAYGKLIPPEIFNLPKHGTLVVHPSLLPKYRGPSPVQTAMLNGDKETGVTIMKIDAEMDHGDIVSAVRYQMPDAGSFKEINNEIWQSGAKLLIKTLPDYLTDKVKPRPQDHSQATYTRKFTTDDGEIKSTDEAEQAYNKIRALNPEPGTYIWFEKNGPPSRKATEGRGKKMRLKILEAELKSGHLEFKKVQLESGKPMSVKEFAVGHPDFTNNLL